MAYFSRWDRGDWDAICDSCGRKFKASKLKQRWDGLMVCHQDWEKRQPQDFVRGVPDPQLVPWVRDEPEDAYTFTCDLISSQGIADYAVADCARAGIDNGYRPECTTSGSSSIAWYAVSGCAVAGKIPFGWDITL